MREPFTIQIFCVLLVSAASCIIKCVRFSQWDEADGLFKDIVASETDREVHD